MTNAADERVLTDIVNHIRGKGLSVLPDQEHSKGIILAIPFPTTRKSGTTDEEPAYMRLTPDLWRSLQPWIVDAVSNYLGNAGEYMTIKYRGRQVTMGELKDIQAYLDNHEARRRAEGKGELWEYLAEALGLMGHVSISLKFTPN